MTSAEKLAYCAGIIDGEGSLYITKNTKTDNKPKRYFAGIKIAMNDRPALDLFKSIFGGKVVKGSRKLDKRVGKIYAPAWVLQYRGVSDIKAILYALKPYLVVKNKQAEVILEFLTLKEAVWPNLFKKNAALNNKYVQSRAIKKSGWEDVIIVRQDNKETLPDNIQKIITETFDFLGIIDESLPQKLNS